MEFLVRGRDPVRRARRLHGLRGDRRGARPRTSARSGFDLDDLADAARSSRSTTSTSSAARSRRPASTTSKACSSASATPSTRSAPSASCSTRIETLFGGLSNAAILRAELRRLFRWLKDKGVTAVITGERGEGTLTRQGLEEYVSDCVILLDHRVDRAGLDPPAAHRQVPRHDARHQRVSVPDRRGRHLACCRSPRWACEHAASDERISTGVPRLDAMLGGKGIYRGSSVLVSGTAGTGKTSLAAHFADAACRRGERCLYFAFEESQGQIVRNMRSIGLDLEPLGAKGPAALPRHRAPTAVRPGDAPGDDPQAGHEFEPRVVIVDPISNFTQGRHARRRRRAMLMRLIDFLKAQRHHRPVHQPDDRRRRARSRPRSASRRSSTPGSCCATSSSGGERNRGIYVLKSRGMAHSNQIREFLLTDHGIELSGGSD